jgi:hypothetical protein
MKPIDFSAFPGGDLIRQGLEDLGAGREFEEALLVLIGAPRLRALGLHVPETNSSLPEHRLYELLADTDTDRRTHAITRLSGAWCASSEPSKGRNLSRDLQSKIQNLC